MMSTDEGSQSAGILASLGLVMRDLREGVRQISESATAGTASNSPQGVAEVDRPHGGREAQSDAGGSSVPQEFDEEAYLALYPDVRRSVEAGQLASGFAHFVASGKSEGRAQPMKPVSTIVPSAVLAGSSNDMGIGNGSDPSLPPPRPHATFLLLPEDDEHTPQKIAHRRTAKHLPATALSLCRGWTPPLPRALIRRAARLVRLHLR